ncbi:MAG: bifunctional ornithine acetyltransferase/N-acetylglutamate synthase [Terriglobales bacterium]
MVAAPIRVGRESLTRTRGRVRAVIVNSGNANCATGMPVVRACRTICDEVGRLLHVRGEEVFPSSTGIIGIPLPTQLILSKLPELVSRTAATDDAFRQFAQAILTTDTRAKLAAASFNLGNKKATIAGVAKGAGMIHPQLATMLVYIFRRRGRKSIRVKTMSKARLRRELQLHFD